MQRFTDSLNHISKKNPSSTILVGGDFNLPFIDWTNYSYIPGGNDKESCNILLECFNTNSFEQLVHEPTRCIDDTNNILDLCAINRPELVESVRVDEGIGDHKVVVVKLKLSYDKLIKPLRRVYIFKRANIPHLKKF